MAGYQRGFEFLSGFVAEGGEGRGETQGAFVASVGEGLSGGGAVGGDAVEHDGAHRVVAGVERCRAVGRRQRRRVIDRLAEALQGHQGEEFVAARVPLPGDFGGQGPRRIEIEAVIGPRRPFLVALGATGERQRRQHGEQTPDPSPAPGRGAACPHYPLPLAGRPSPLSLAPAPPPANRGGAVAASPARVEYRAG